MPIVDHPKWKTPIGNTGYYDNCQVVECDFCHRQANHHGSDPGEAAEAARKEGFQTVKGAKLGDPRKWWCGKCDGT